MNINQYITQRKKQKPCNTPRRKVNSDRHQQLGRLLAEQKDERAQMEITQETRLLPPPEHQAFIF